MCVYMMSVCICAFASVYSCHAYVWCISVPCVFRVTHVCNQSGQAHRQVWSGGCPDGTDADSLCSVIHSHCNTLFVVRHEWHVCVYTVYYVCDITVRFFLNLSIAGLTMVGLTTGRKEKCRGRFCSRSLSCWEKAAPVTCRLRVSIVCGCSALPPGLMIKLQDKCFNILLLHYSCSLDRRQSWWQAWRL